MTSGGKGSALVFLDLRAFGSAGRSYWLLCQHSHTVGSCVPLLGMFTSLERERTLPQVVATIRTSAASTKYSGCVDRGPCSAME